MGRSGGSRPYHRKRKYRHSFTSSSVLFTVDSCTFSQSPVFFAPCNQRAPWTGDQSMVASRASSARWALRFQTAVRPSWRHTKWSAVRKSTWPLSAATRCPVMTQGVVHFSGDVIVGSGRANTVCFTFRQMTLLPAALSPNPSMSSGKKVSRSAFCTWPKASPILGLTC